MSRILLVEDETDIALLLADDLRLDGHEVEIAATGPAAVDRGKRNSFDLILLDVMLPGKDGFDVCRELRRSGIDTPIVLLTARSQESEKVMGFELGADDYVTKPFSPRELRARIKAILRRRGDVGNEVLRFGEFEVDLTRAEVRRSGVALDVTPLEFKILSVFARNAGRVLSRDQLIQQAWGIGTHITDRAVDTHIVGIRRKIESGPEARRHLVSVRGIGYRLEL